MTEWIAFILFPSATALLVTLPESGWLVWLSFTVFVPFYVWAIVPMTEGEDVTL
jgi:hypothetical protein